MKPRSQFHNGIFSCSLTQRSHMAATRFFLYLIFAVLCSLSLNASATGKTRIFYSAYFSGYVPTASLEGATFFGSYAGGLGVRFSSTESVAGTIITHELENLDADFNLADYPLYFFGLKDTADLSPEVAKPFDNSREEMRSSMNNPPIDTLKIDGATVYIACTPHCEALVVQESQAEQILHLTSRGLGQSELVSILTGHQHAAE